jgi:deoxyribonuclease-2
MRGLFSALILYGIFSPLTQAISCKDESGQDIPTWSILKLPKGTDYYYYDTTNGFSFSPHSLNDTSEGALAHTMAQLWDSTTQYILYNDEPPNQIAYNFSVAHSKAVWMWDEESAILITHSIPKFTRGPQETPKYEALMSNAHVYGQAISCFPVSLSALPSTLKLVQDTNPDIYEQSCETCYHLEGNITQAIKKDNYTSNPCNIYTIDNKYQQFMKPESLELDIYSSCISPYYESNIKVESWVHGTQDGPYCPPKFQYETLDIKELKFPEGQTYTEYDDHSKWAILNSPIVCFGDLNRVTSQFVRSGIVYCWEDETLWATLNKLIQITDYC